jgi:hypothetical protein
MDDFCDTVYTLYVQENKMFQKRFRIEGGCGEGGWMQGKRRRGAKVEPRLRVG